MRNLKRALALALSSVMLMGMMVVGTSAASYPDVDASNDSEAIEVAQTLEIMVGDDKGNFNPDQVLTRAEAAAVIAKLLDLELVDFKGADLAFTDVADWAAPWVAAVNAEGIMVGYDADTFGSNDPVTAVQYALMVMKTLGYFQFEGDYGEDWVLAAAKQAGKIELFDGLDVSVNAPLTREQVARVTLNALEATMVEADGNEGLKVEGEGFTITTGAVKYEDVLKTNAKYGKIDATQPETGKYTVELGEELFDGKLIKDTTANDELGRPATEWKYKNDVVGTYAKTADETVIITDAAEQPTALKAYQELVDDDYKTADGIAHAVKINGASATALAKGDKVEYFMDTDGKIDYAIVTRYQIAKITDVETDLSKADLEKDATCEIELDEGLTYLDVDVAGFDAETYVEDAYILVAPNADKQTGENDFVASELAASFTGTIDAIRNNGKVRVDGEYYAFNGANTYCLDTAEMIIDAKGTFYTDLAGVVVAFDGETEKSDNYAFVYNTVLNTGDEDKFGNASNSYTAYVVLADGTLASYVIEEDSETAILAAEGKVIAYSVNKDGEIEFELAADKIYDTVISGEAADKDDAMVGTYKTVADTEFVFVDFQTDDNGKDYGETGYIYDVETSVATGYKNVDFDSADTFVVYDNDTDKTALYVFVIGNNDDLTTDKNIAVVCDNAYHKWVDAEDDIYYTYTAMSIEGEQVDLTVKNGEWLTYTVGAAYEYELDADGLVILSSWTPAGTATNAVKADGFFYGTIEAVTDNYVVIDGSQYNLGDEVRYTIISEYELDTNNDYDAIFDSVKYDLDEISVKDGAKLEKDATAFYVVDDDELVSIYVEKDKY